MPELRITDAIDVAIVAIMLWAALAWLRRARARIALAGVAIAAAAYLLARQLELSMTIWILQGFFAGASARHPKPFILEGPSQGIQDAEFVIDQQNAFCHARCLPRQS